MIFCMKIVGSKKNVLFMYWTRKKIVCVSSPGLFFFHVSNTKIWYFKVRSMLLSNYHSWKVIWRHVKFVFYRVNDILKVFFVAVPMSYMLFKLYLFIFQCLEYSHMPITLIKLSYSWSWIKFFSNEVKVYKTMAVRWAQIVKFFNETCEMKIYIIIRLTRYYTLVKYFPKIWRKSSYIWIFVSRLVRWDQISTFKLGKDSKIFFQNCLI